MGNADDRVPKPYRHKLHRLKNAYRKAYRREPELKRPVTEEDALRAISLLEKALREAGAIPADEESPASAATANRRRHR
jgi:hypothetical protein